MGIKVYLLLFLCVLYQMPDSLLKLHALLPILKRILQLNGNSCPYCCLYKCGKDNIKIFYIQTRRNRNTVPLLLNR